MPCVKAPVAICVSVPVSAMLVRINWEVAVAMCTGKFNRCISTGTWMIPPPMPNRLERKPTAMLTTTPRGW